MSSPSCPRSLIVSGQHPDPYIGSRAAPLPFGVPQACSILPERHQNQKGTVGIRAHATRAIYDPAHEDRGLCEARARRARADHPDTLRLDRRGRASSTTFDKHAIEAALRIAEADSGAETIVVSVGPPDAEESLRTALAMGADRAVLVSDDAAGSSDLVGTAKLLAAVLGREAPDLVLFGQQASDGGGAVLWAAVAELLGQPFVSQASTLDVHDRRDRGSRGETEYGNDVIEAPLPALVAVSDAINEPRYTSLKGRMAAKKKPLETLSVGELGLDAGGVGAAGARTEVLGVAAPPSRGTTVTVEDEAGAPRKRSSTFLVERELV